MGVWETLLRAGRELTVLTERVDRLRLELDVKGAELADLRERVIRIETLIDIARSRASPGSEPSPSSRLDRD